MTAGTREHSRGASPDRLAQIVAEIGAAAGAGVDRLAGVGLDAAVEVSGASGGELRLLRSDGRLERSAWRGVELQGSPTWSHDLVAAGAELGRLEVWGEDLDRRADGALRVVVMCLAQTIENRTLELAAREQRRRGRRFAASVEALRHPAGPGEAVELTLRGARELLGGDAACLLSGRGRLQVASYDGMEPLDADQAAALVPDAVRLSAERDGGWSGPPPPESGLRERGLTRVALVPVGVRGSLGILCVFDACAEERSQDELRSLNDYAVHAAAAMTAAVLGQEVRELGAVDPLTRFFNARYFHTRLEQETQRALRTQTPLSVAVMALDGLAATRERGDEVASDEAMESLAALVVPRLRGMDVGCRVGEDELAAILPAVGGIEAYKVGERLRAAVGADPNLAGRTLSVGVATFPDQSGTPDQLADRGVAALAWARRHGGDRTFLYTHEVVRALERELRDDDRPERGASEIGDTVMVTVTALAGAVDARHPTTVGHAEGVARLAAAIGAELGLDPARVEDLRVAGLLHDVGKIGISEEILVKDGPLSPSEWEEMRRHPEMGHRMLAGARLDVVRSWVLHHHERLDGTGYPEGIGDDDIPLEAKILAVADAFDAMVHDRPYRTAIAAPAAVAELRRCAGSQFDPDVVGALAQLLERGAPELHDDADPT